MAAKTSDLEAALRSLQDLRGRLYQLEEERARVFRRELTRKGARSGFDETLKIIRIEKALLDFITGEISKGKRSLRIYTRKLRGDLLVLEKSKKPFKSFERCVNIALGNLRAYNSLMSEFVADFRKALERAEETLEDSPSMGAGDSSMEELLIMSREKLAEAETCLHNAKEAVEVVMLRDTTEYYII
jgi:hypothetical protein